ncbi:MAG TPA: HD domain-containing protein, partial [Ktedonobacteraceae bacterium]|nr:HD domain-containing protein [Ktedonobacteraceae bacterium]
MKSHRAWYQTACYRLGQGMQHFGRVASLTAEDNTLLVSLLPPAGQDLFRTMSPVDQQHCLRVCRGLQASGCSEEEMLAAALLHDVGKGQGRVPFWTRPALVLGKYFFPTLLKRLL